MANLRRFLNLGTGYGLSVVISGLLSVAVIPVVIVVAGAQTWAVIAVAQAVGGFGYVVAAAGWGVTGPTAVAKLPKGERGAYYSSSLTTRGWLFVASFIPSVFIAIALADREPLVSILAVATSVMAALSAGWFYVGEERPIRFLLIETLPRTLGTALGALILLLTHEVLWFLALQLLGAVVSASIATIDILGRHRGWRFTASPFAAIRNLRGHGPAMTMSATTSIYVNLPIVIVQIFLPAFTPVYALGERMMRLALYSTRPLVQTSQGYVPARDGHEMVRRARRVIRVMGLVALIGGLAYALLGPLAGTILSGWQLDVPFSLTVPLGVALMAILLSQVTGFACLTAFGSDRTLATSTATGAVIGVVLFLPLTLLWGVAGVAWALAVSELIVLGVQLMRLRTLFAAVPSPDPGSSPVAAS